MKNAWDKVITSAPLNKTAAVVAGGKGEHWEPHIGGARDGVVRQFHCPPLRQPSEPGNLTGKRFGRLVVQGLHAEISGGSWVVRCDCGAFETRKAKVLNDPGKALNHMCSHCNYLEKIKLPETPSLIERKRIVEARKAAKEGTPA